MTIRRASVILPGRGWDDFPNHLGDRSSAEVLAAWTSLWHPAIVAATGRLPGSYWAEETPDPSLLDGELVLVPPPSRQRMPGDWCERVAATGPANPPPVATFESRSETVAAMLAAAGIDPKVVAEESVADFFALGFANLQVELLTRAMRYSSVLDTQQFESGVVAAAKAAVAGNQSAAHEELGRAFDLLTDARNHVYSVDFYLIDVTLLAGSTLGPALQAKLARQSPTSLLITGEQIERLAGEFPETLAELQRAIETGTVSIVGGLYRGGYSAGLAPEALLAALNQGQQTALRVLEREFEVFGQYEAAFSPLLPQVLKGLGFQGALHAAFDGGQVPRADQRKTNWGANTANAIPALSATPLDAGRAETWLQLAERVGDSIARDHVATVVLAGWPGAESEYFEDLRRVARFGTVLGKLITLDEYFRVTRDPDEWTTFYPREYSNRFAPDNVANPISTQVDAYRSHVQTTHTEMGTGLVAVAGLKLAGVAQERSDSLLAVNPWNSASNQFIGVDPLASNDQPAPNAHGNAALLLLEVLGCGYAALSTAAAASPVALATDLTLRNEQLELTVSAKTGGIQSLRMHRDRNTRVSQRLVFHDNTGAEPQDSQMVADSVKITRNDALIGEITSTGQLLSPGKKLLARFTQRVRIARGLSPVIVEVEFDPQRMPEGELWKMYYASRLAWVDDALTIRRGEQWVSREVTRERIETLEWVEIDDVVGRITCFAMGLPYHRRAAPNWLDTLLIVTGEERRRFQFAIGLDNTLPSQAGLRLLTAGKPCMAEMSGPLNSPRGWFLHIGGKNVLLTHIEPLPGPAAGVRLRLLETEGRDTRTSLDAFRPIQAARITDFRGNAIEVLSVSDGRAEIDIGPHRWLQIEAEFVS